MANKQLYTNNATTTINGGITNVATSIALSPGTGSLFPSPTSGDWFIGTLYDGVSVIEVVKVTARSSDTLTVVRGQEGTSGSAFLTGASFMENVTKGTLEQFIQRTGDAIEDTPIGAVTPSTGAFTGVTGTSFNKLTIVAPATTASLAITDTKSVSFLKSLTFTGTDGITLTFPATNATIARTDAAQTFTGAQTVLAAATQDAISLAGRAGGTGGYILTLTPTTLTSSRTATFPNDSITVARSDAAQTFTGLQTFATGITSTAASNSLGATVFSGAITGGQALTAGASTLGATTATTLAVAGATLGSHKITSAGGLGLALRADASSGYAYSYLYDEGSNFFRWYTGGSATGADWKKLTLDFNGTPISSYSSTGDYTIAGSVATKASGTTWANPSDARLKRNVLDYGKGIAEFMQLRFVEGEYNGLGGTATGQKFISVIAQEAKLVLPDSISTFMAKLNPEDETETEFLKYDSSETLVLTSVALQQNIRRVDSHESRLSALEVENASLKAKIALLETI